MPVTTETPLQISLGKALAGAFFLAALSFSGSYFIMSEVKDDVAATRSDVSELRQMSREDVSARETNDAALRQSLADLTAQLQITTSKLSEVTDSLTNLDGSIRTIDSKLSASISRQQELEKSIVTRLDANVLGAQQIPVEWFKSQSAILTSLKAGSDPLTEWYKGLPEQQQ